MLLCVSVCEPVHVPSEHACSFSVLCTEGQISKDTKYWQAHTQVQPMAANICPHWGKWWCLLGSSSHLTALYSLVPKCICPLYPRWVCSETLENQEALDAQFPSVTQCCDFIDHSSPFKCPYESRTCCMVSSWPENSRTVAWIVSGTAWTCYCWKIVLICAWWKLGPRSTDNEGQL